MNECDVETIYVDLLKDHPDANRNLAHMIAGRKEAGWRLETTIPAAFQTVDRGDTLVVTAAWFIFSRVKDL